jgi:multiple sugar transport system permease protein
MKFHLSRKISAGSNRRRLEIITFYLFISPMLVGFLLFMAYPVVFSFILSFSKWDLMSDYVVIGLKNYRKILFDDKYFYISMKVTFLYALMSVPLNLIVSFLVAVLMNVKLRGINIFRTLWYAPVVTPAIAVAVVWRAIFEKRYGLLNQLLSIFGISGPNWLWDQVWTLPALVIMSLWGVGGSMVIYLAALQGVPGDLYEAADIDGANTVRKFISITIPMVSPAIFFNVVMSTIGMLQYFTNAYVMTGGGPNNATLFYALYLYRNAFDYLKMGYGSALAWILFAITMAMTLLIFKSSPLWVHYETDMMENK